MLVSRGPVYTSGQAAGEVVGVRGVARGKRKTGELFHDHCGCTVVELYGSWEDWKPTAREQEFIDLYNSNGGSLKCMRAAIDAIKEVSPAKEYLLGAGKHMTVIRRDPKTNMFYYLELQSGIPEENGWQPLTNKGQRKRFDWLVSLERKYGTKIDESATLMEVDSLKENRVFLDLLGIWAQAQKTS